MTHNDQGVLLIEEIVPGTAAVPVYAAARDGRVDATQQSGEVLPYQAVEETYWGFATRKRGASARVSE